MLGCEGHHHRIFRPYARSAREVREDEKGSKATGPLCILPTGTKDGSFRQMLLVTRAGNCRLVKGLEDAMRRESRVRGVCVRAKDPARAGARFRTRSFHVGASVHAARARYSPARR